MTLGSVRHPFPPNGISELLELPANAINLAESTLPDLLSREIAQFADLPPDLPLGYGSSVGSLDLREEIARFSGADAQEIITTQGAIQALLLVALATSAPADEIVVATPCFPPTRDSLAVTGATVLELPLEFDRGYRIDLGQLAEMLSPATTLVSLASPSNPAGVQIAPVHLQAIVSLLRKAAPSAWLLIDETYRAACPAGRPAVSAATLDRRIISISSLSKAFGTPGLRVGWLISRDGALREAVQRARLNIALSCSVLDEAVATRLLAQFDGLLRARSDTLQRRLDIVSAWAGRHAKQVEWIRPDAGALCAVRLRKQIVSDSAVAHFYAEARRMGVLLAPGRWFRESDRIFRLGLGYPSEVDLMIGLGRLGELLLAADSTLAR